jgi:hypothetical protein
VAQAVIVLCSTTFPYRCVPAPASDTETRVTNWFRRLEEIAAGVEIALITQRSEVQILPPQLKNAKSGHRKVAFFVALAEMSDVQTVQSQNRFPFECSQNAHRFPRMPRSNASAAFFRCVSSTCVYTSAVI